MKRRKKRLSNLSFLLKNKWTCGHKLLVSERLVIDRSMLSPFSWERLYHQYYQISKALYVSGLKTGYKLKINFYSQNVVIFHQFKASVLLVTHHNTQKFGIAELRYFSEKRKPNYCLHARKFCPIFN